MAPRNLHPVFGGAGLPSLTVLKSLRVSGGAAALVDKLQQETDYDRMKVIAAGVITTDSVGNVKSTHWVTAGTLKTASTAANKIWPGANKDIQVIFRITDLTIFEFPACSNMSAWLDAYDVDARFASKATKAHIDWEEARTRGVGNLSVRAVVVPGTHMEASVWISVIPMNLAELTDKVGTTTVNSPSIPHITIHVEEMEENAPSTFSNGRAVTATLVQQEMPQQNLGMGCLPFIDCTSSDDESQGLPEPAKYKEAALKFFRNIRMGIPTSAANFLNTLDKVIEGTAAPQKKAPVVFPDFTAPVTSAG